MLRLTLLNSINRRLYSTSIGTVPTIGKISYKGGSPYPALSLQLPNKSSFLFALKPWLTVNQVLSVVKQEDGTIQSLTMYHRPEHEASGDRLETWSHSTTLEDILKTAFKVKTTLPSGEEESTPGLYLSINGQLGRVTLPTFEERTKEQQSEKQDLLEAIKPLADLKANCDTWATRYSESLVWGGFLGLVAQWAIISELTWISYSWDFTEPITWFVNMGNTVLAYGFFMVYRKDFSCESLSNLTVTKRQMALYKKKGLDINKYVYLNDKIRALDAEMERIKQEYV